MHTHKHTSVRTYTDLISLSFLFYSFLAVFLPFLLFSSSDRYSPGLNYIIPHSSDQPYDILDVVTTVVDEGDFFEIMPDYARNIIIGFARFNGRSVGIIGNQPNQKAGMISKSWM